MIWSSWRSSIRPTSTVDFTDWRIRGGIDFNFAPGDPLLPSQALIVIRFNPDSPDNATRLAAFRQHYDLQPGVKILGGYDQQLSGSGERVTLLRPDTSIADPVVRPLVQEDEVTYDDRLPWPADAGGTGNSLQREAPSLYGNEGNSWNAAAATPGQVPFAPQPGDFDSDGELNLTDITLLFQQLQSPQPTEGFDLNGDGLLNDDDRDALIVDLMGTTYGDANLNRVFDSNDLIDALAAGQYNDGIAGNSTWDTGDWNGDGEFDDADLLLAAQWGGYEGAPKTK